MNEEQNQAANNTNDSTNGTNDGNGATNGANNTDSGTALIAAATLSFASGSNFNYNRNRNFNNSDNLGYGPRDSPMVIVNTNLVPFLQKLRDPLRKFAKWQFYYFFEKLMNCI